jgi:hypothetical protein
MTSATAALTEPQKRSLEVTLRLAEKALDSMQHLLGERKAGILYRPVSGLAPGQQEELLALASQAKNIIGRLAADFGLEPVEEPLDQQLAAIFSSVWCDLEDVRPDKLKRYGDVDPTLGETLEPALAELIELVVRIADTARQNRA